MTADVRRIESKLRQIVASAECRICAERTSSCPGCGHPVGPLPSEVDHARAVLSARLDSMHGRLARLDSVLTSVLATSTST